MRSIASTDPFSFMSMIYLILASLGAFLSFLSITTSFYFDGIEWIRVHLVTLGVIIQFLYGYLPKRVTNDNLQPVRWDIFFLLNIGILTFLTGRYFQIQPVMLTGGLILFLTTILLTHQLYSLRVILDFTSGTIFYLTGLAYFFLGIIMGTGIWLGWASTLQVSNILEVHIHANNWGLLSFVFAGLFLDKYEDWFGVPLANPQNFKRIYYLLLVGTFGLVLGPWVASKPIIVPGLIAHLVGTVLLLRSIISPLKASLFSSTPNLHLFSAYVWFFAPVVISPLVLLGVSWVPSITVEARAPEALIFGWAIQIILLVLVYFRKPQVNIAALDTIVFALFNLGALLLWVSIFSSDFFYGLAYLFWSVAILIVAIKGLRNF
jgi:hypothetical protein